MNDTFTKANVFGNDLHIYKIIEAKVNDSTMIFDQYDSHSEKSIEFQFKLAKGL